MGCWFVCPIEQSGAHDRWLAVARDQFKKHGHTSPTEFQTATHVVLASGAIHPHNGNIFRLGDGFIAVAGTLFYRGQFGTSALESLFADFREPFSQWDDVVGQFAVVLSKAGRLHVFGDYFGIFNIFESTDGRFLSTSFLSLTRVLDRLTLDAQSAYEFAYNSGVLGDASLFKEIRLVGPTRQLALGESRVEHRVEKFIDVQPSRRSLDDLVEEQSAQLARLGRVVADAFASNVYCPLSGGYDSRLLLALLRSAGNRPRVYVYGKGEAPDVRISTEIGTGEGFAVEHVDKQTYSDLSGAEFAEHVERDFNLVDGMSVDGSVFDNGGNAAARRRLQADATITSSGGGGEIFRNFFRLGDRPFTLRNVVHAFYRQFDPRTATHSFDSGRYDAAIEKKMSRALNGADGQIDRRLIEQLYPAFRCRANFGREISIVGRYGAYFVPFLEASTVRIALKVPLWAKNNGQFEALLIRRIDPSLARYRTVHGADPFSPYWRSRVDEATTRMRPVWLRKLSYRLRSRLWRHSDGHGGLLDRAHLGAVIDLGFPVMRAYFKPENFRDDGLLRRVALMEYLVERLGSKVATS